MSAEARTAIAAAATTVEGVRCTPYYRQSFKTGDACVRLSVTNRAANGFGRINTWEVWIALPQDVATAERWLDEHVDALVAALNPEFIGGVQSVTPSQLVLDTSSTPLNGVVISGAREG